MSDPGRHWEQVYRTSDTTTVGWYQPHLLLSLAWIESLKLPSDAPVIDVGGGASTLVDDLLERGYRDVTVVDLSATALQQSRARLGPRAEAVHWLQDDITEMRLPARRYAFWHDRAVFHFLLEEDMRQAYHRQLLHALQPGGHVYLGVFAPEAPPRCSGLPVRRHSLEQLQQFMGPSFICERSEQHTHVTPSGVKQAYQHALFRRVVQAEGFSL